MKREINVEELKQIQINILDYVAAFCDENNIKYWINSGTLLGAVRHGGYIPWDDDIDLGMLREDYDRFISTYSDPTGRFSLIGYEADGITPVSFLKVIDNNTVLYEPDETGLRIAVYIDIFVYDNAPESLDEVERMYDVRDNYFRLINSQNDKTWPEGMLHKASMLLYRLRKVYFKGRCYYVKKMIVNAKRYNTGECARVGDFLAFLRFTCDKDVLSEMTEIAFEGKKYKAPKRYDEWLTAMYGDYMTLPPVEERVSHHKFKAYYTDDRVRKDI
ncbi:MAG: LicD family protein [Lachnospiraceae bacterium]|nr:LicD family protein [Lachnospiraceae bacterium]